MRIIIRFKYTLLLLKRQGVFILPKMIRHRNVRQKLIEKEMLYMDKKAYLVISAVTAFIFTIVLLFLKTFKFISWNPTGWSKKYQLFTETHISVKWIILGCILFLFILFLLKLLSYTKNIHPLITSIVLGICLWIGVEWMIASDFSFLKKSAIPFMAIVLIFTQALAETAVYYGRVVHQGN